MTIQTMVESKDSFLGSNIKKALDNFKTSKDSRKFPEIEMLANTLGDTSESTFELSNGVYYRIVQGRNNNGIFRDSSVKTLYVKRDLVKSPRTFKAAN